MIDAALLPLQRRVLHPPARRLAALGVTADQITLAGFVIGALGLPALLFGQYGLALGLIALNRIMDGLDGAVARLTAPTDRGAFLDIALDFVFSHSCRLACSYHMRRRKPDPERGETP